VDGILRTLTSRTWEGTLHGHRGPVLYAGGRWHYGVIDGCGHVKIGPPVASLAEGAARQAITPARTVLALLHRHRWR
jgi:hypothetical protein